MFVAKNEAANKRTEPNQLGKIHCRHVGSHDNFNVLPTNLPATQSGFAPENFNGLKTIHFLFEAKGLLSELLLLVSAVVENTCQLNIVPPPQNKKTDAFCNGPAADEARTSP